MPAVLLMPARLSPLRLAAWGLLMGALSARAAGAQRERNAVTPIQPPAVPLPAEAASAGTTRFSFIVYGDTRGRRDGVATQEEHEFVVDGMLAAVERLKTGPDPVRFVLQSGDAVVNGRDPRQWNVSFVGLINRITQQGGVPYFLAPGNHDVTAAEALSDAGRREGLRNYLAAVEPLIPANGSMRRLDGYPTYAFGYGNTFVLAFDSNIADDAKQYAWVKAQLEGLDRTRYVHVVVMFHHPVLSSGPHGGSTVEPPADAVRRRYMPLFRQHHVRLLVTGHEHLFEHWVERWTDAQGTWRLDQIVSGGGGAPLYAFEGNPDQRAYLRASKGDGVRLTQLVRPGPRAGDSPYHFCIVHVNGAAMWMEVVGIGSSWQPYAGGRVVLTDSVPR
jgi:hypothetical protein